MHGETPSTSCMEFILTNQYITQLCQKSFELRYNVFGTVAGVHIFDANSSTSIPVGNADYAELTNYIDANGIRPKPDIQWVKIALDAKGSVLYFRTNLGDFVDSDNPITNQIKLGIESKSIEIRKAEYESPWTELEVSVFLPRTYTISKVGLSPVACYEFIDDEISLPFSAQVSLLQSIEVNYFNNNNHLREVQKNLSGNVIRIRFTQKQIESAYKWFAPQLEVDQMLQPDSMQANMALHKRSKRRGPTTNWYFDWVNLQEYIWGPILEATNRLIGLMNHQAHRKTMALMSRDDLGDVTCLKAKKGDGTCFLWPLSSLRDQQINIFPEELNWKHNLVQLSLYRVRHLLDRSLYFEAIVVAQATLEAIINGMFSDEVSRVCFDKANIRWEQKYQKLKQFFDKTDDQFLIRSALYPYLDGRLHRIYELRNGYAHDIIEHRPNYDFTLSTLKEVSQLLKPITDTWESIHFLRAVDAMYRLRPEFLSFLLQERKEIQQPMQNWFRRSIAMLRGLGSGCRAGK